MPPCPGIRLPLSLTPHCLFITLSVKSPSCDKIVIIMLTIEKLNKENYILFTYNPYCNLPISCEKTMMVVRYKTYYTKQ